MGSLHMTCLYDSFYCFHWVSLYSFENIRGGGVTAFLAFFACAFLEKVSSHGKKGSDFKAK